MPIEKRCTTSPRRRAARKWPSSWTKIEPPKKNTIRKIDQKWDSSECRRPGDIGFQLAQFGDLFVGELSGRGISGERGGQVRGVEVVGKGKSLLNHAGNGKKRNARGQEGHDGHLVGGVEDRGGDSPRLHRLAGEPQQRKTPLVDRSELHGNQAAKVQRGIGARRALGMEQGVLDGEG